MNVTRTKKRAGFLASELTVALSVLAVLLTCFALSLHGFAKFNRYQLIRQRCIAAAQAQLDSITATGKPITEDDIKRLWPTLNVSIERSAGIGQWQGMELIEVTAKGKSFRNKVQVKLSRYTLPVERLEESKTN
jgi:type II secretory pathway pseudopilin PulG